jgi:hypothetical protein
MADRFFVSRMLITMASSFINLVANEGSGDRLSRISHISVGTGHATLVK